MHKIEYLELYHLLVEYILYYLFMHYKIKILNFTFLC